MRNKVFAIAAVAVVGVIAAIIIVPSIFRSNPSDADETTTVDISASVDFAYLDSTGNVVVVKELSLKSASGEKVSIAMGDALTAISDASGVISSVALPDGTTVAVEETEGSLAVTFDENGFAFFDSINTEPATIDVNEATTAGAVAETTLPDEATTAEQTTAAAAPKTVEEIVAYFNAAANKVKTEKPGYELSITNKVGKDDIYVDSGVLNYIAGVALNAINPSAQSTDTSVAKGESHDLYPVKGQTIASKLSATDVAKATCKDNGATYEIAITLVTEKLADLPTNPSSTRHGKVFNVLSASEVYDQTDKIPGVTISKFAPTYRDSYVKCTVDKATGSIKSAVYFFNTFAEITAKAGFSTLNATVEFGICETYTMK